MHKFLINRCAVAVKPSIFLLNRIVEMYVTLIQQKGEKEMRLCMLYYNKLRIHKGRVMIL